MNKNEPLKELLEIGKDNFELASKIAEKFPLTELDYDVLIDYYLSASPSMKILIEQLINKIPLLGLNIEVLYVQFSASTNSEIKKISAGLLGKHFSDKLDFSTMIKLCEVSSEVRTLLAPVLMDKYERALSCSQLFGLFVLTLPEEIKLKISNAILAIPKEKLDYKELKNRSRKWYGIVSDIASTILLKEFEADLDVVTLIYMMKSNNEEIIKKALSLLVKMSGKIKYKDVILLQEKSDEDVRAAAVNAAYLIPLENLDAAEVVRGLVNTDKDVNDLAYKLLERLPSSKLPFDQLCFYVSQGATRQREYASTLLLSKFAETLSYETLTEIFNLSSVESTYESAALLILKRFAGKVEAGLLEEMKIIKHPEVREIRQKLIKNHEKELMSDVSGFLRKHSL